VHSRHLEDNRIAQSRVLRHPFDIQPSCLVLDVRMPGVGEFEFQHELINSGSEIPSLWPISSR
jgi:FixJ family two-component response regulator